MIHLTNRTFVMSAFCLTLLLPNFIKTSDNSDIKSVMKALGSSQAGGAASSGPAETSSIGMLGSICSASLCGVSLPVVAGTAAVVSVVHALDKHYFEGTPFTDVAALFPVHVVTKNSVIKDKDDKIVGEYSSFGFRVLNSDIMIQKQNNLSLLKTIRSLSIPLDINVLNGLLVVASYAAVQYLKGAGSAPDASAVSAPSSASTE